MASEIAKLDADGKPLAAFWNAGHVNVLRETTLKGRRVMLVGGTHNESYAGFLAVLDYENPAGCSPASTERYRCKEYPVGGFLHYLIFPPSEIGRTTSARVAVGQINLRSDAMIEVMVNEDTINGEPAAGVTYILDDDFKLIEAEVGESYKAAHNLLQSKGMLDHALDRLREGNALRMKRWLGDRYSEPIAPKKPRTVQPSK